ARGEMDSALELDAQLGARLIRVYAKDWLRGAGKFAALCLNYLLQDDAKQVQRILKGWLDTANAGAGGWPDGLAEVDPSEGDVMHPALDPELSGVSDEETDAETPKPADAQAQSTAGGAQGQYREPYELGEILKSMGVKLPPYEMAIRYYRE